MSFVQAAQAGGLNRGPLAELIPNLSANQFIFSALALPGELFFAVGLFALLGRQRVVAYSLIRVLRRGVLLVLVVAAALVAVSLPNFCIDVGETNIPARPYSVEVSGAKGALSFKMRVAGSGASTLVMMARSLAWVEPALRISPAFSLFTIVEPIDYARERHLLSATFGLVPTLHLDSTVSVGAGARVSLHWKCMAVAFAASTLFLAGYLTYHALSQILHHYAGPWRPFYLALLGSHTILAVVALPLVLRTMWLSAVRRACALVRASRVMRSRSC